MLFLLVGLAMLGMKLMEIAPVVNWPWWVVFIPFGLAVLWWWWADASGYTKQRAINREDARKKARIDKNRANIGLGPKNKR
jgi:small Trp-rich protein